MATSTGEQEPNQVYLRGVLAAAATIRTLPSGDELCVFRVTVPRPPGDRARVDSIDCATSRTPLRRTALRAEAGDAVEVHGHLRRRFWRSPTGTPASRYEVEVTRLQHARARRASKARD